MEGSVTPFEASDLEIIALDKTLEAQRMEILLRDLPARFDTGASGGPSPGDAMMLALSTFEARMDMLERTCAASDGAPRAVKVKTPEEKWGVVFEGALRMHGCVDASGLPPPISLPVFFTLTALGAPSLAARIRSSISMRASKALRASVMASPRASTRELQGDLRRGTP